VKTEAIVPAQIEFAPGAAPRASAFDDVYHPEAGALGQSEHVFLRGSGLPQRWAGARQFVVLETGFGLGNNFLATRAAWQADAARCGQLVFVSLELHPPRRDDLVRAHAMSPLRALADDLIAAWPPLTPNIHVLDFDGGQVRLLLVLGDARRLLPQLAATIDAFYLDGFTPARNPAMWDRHLIAALARLARPGATAATWSVARKLHDGLAAAGFVVERAPGFDRKHEMTLARYAPHFAPRRSPGRSPAAYDGEGTAIVVGAGIAGACAAAALARLGWQCTVLDRHAEPASEASGNPAGLFHGTAHAVDGVHARLHRAAALRAAQLYAPLIAAGRVTGSTDGLRRVRPGTMWAGLPPEYVRSSGKDSPAFYPAAGWVAPRELVRELLDDPAITFCAHAAVHTMAHEDGRWRVRGADQVLAEAPVLVLAGAEGNQGLMQSIGHPGWPTQPSRGQVTWFSSSHRLTLPVTGEGYAVTLPGGDLLCGASSQDDDLDPTVRDTDHAFNLERLQALAGISPEPGTRLHGRVGWRSQAPDRLPIVGAVPVARHAIGDGTRLDQARLVPRLPGLFVLGGLGSRGLTWGPLAGEVLAAWIEGAPMPLEGDLLDAIDPARWIVRAARAG
jgi:tRNA 5-methylaminomethyl-2-thiouridine biosynthesis bifunctional protein